MKNYLNVGINIFLSLHVFRLETHGAGDPGEWGHLEGGDPPGPGQPPDGDGGRLLLRQLLGLAEPVQVPPGRDGCARQIEIYGPG